MASLWTPIPTLPSASFTIWSAPPFWEAGGVYHAVLGPDRLDPKGFGYAWSDGRKMTTILGIHLVLLGIGALLLVLKATQFGGLYDPAIANVRLVPQPTLNPLRIFGYLVGITP